MVDLYLLDSETRMGVVESAWQQKQPDELGRAAHALKSSSANMGALAFSRLCAQAEQLGKAGDQESLEELVPLMLTMASEVREALGALRDICA